MPDAAHLIGYTIIAISLAIAVPLAMLLACLAFSCFVAWLNDRRHETEARDLAGGYSDTRYNEFDATINEDWK